MAAADNYNKDPVRKRFSDRVKQVIEMYRNSVTALEREMGLTNGYIGEAVRGDKRMTIEMLLAVVKHLELDPDEFFAGTTPEELRWKGGYPLGGQRPSDVAEGAPASSAVVDALVRVLLAKGVVTADEVEAEMRR